MCKITQFYSQQYFLQLVTKKGAGKVSTTFSLEVTLANKSQKVLLVNADLQGDLTAYMI